MAAKAVWLGWVMFAGVMMLVSGGLNIIEGIVALFNDQRVVLVQGRLYLIDVTVWGWILLLLGLALAGVGLGLLFGQTWARITAVVLVAIHAVLQVLWIGAYPIWAMLMVGIDTVVLFALIARWKVAEAEEEPALDEDPPAHTVAPAGRSGVADVGQAGL